MLRLLVETRFIASKISPATGSYRKRIVAPRRDESRHDEGKTAPLLDNVPMIYIPLVSNKGIFIHFLHKTVNIFIILI
jgi:hypothetical protein